MIPSWTSAASSTWCPPFNGFHVQPDKESLDRFVRRSTKQPPAMGLQDLLEAVAEVFEVSLAQLASASRWSRLQEARGACGILVREVSGLRFRSLAKRLRHSESALGHLVRRHSKQAKEDELLVARIESARGRVLKS